MKGVAGNIGLEPDICCGGKAGASHERAGSGCPLLLEEFARVLRRQVQAIRRAGLNVMPQQRTERKNGTGSDSPSAATAIAHVRALLESGDCEAAEAFRVLEAALAGNLDRHRLDALSAAISELDFDGALLQLDEIAKEYDGMGIMQNEPH